MTKKKMNFIEEDHKKHRVSNRKNLTLATILALSQACNPSNVRLGYEFVREGDKIYLDESWSDANGKVVKKDKHEMNIDSPKTFQVVDYFMGKDNLHVYYLRAAKNHVEIIAGADPETFEVYPYINDTSGYEHGGHTFYRDKNHLYNMGVIVEGVNPNTADLSSRRYDGTIRDNGHTFKWDGQKFITVN